jgi:predicted O-linked N-acetylglucosamine transferase (SPINDLY family)
VERELVTFGTFNNSMKVSEPTMRAWARLLQKVPRSRLVIKSMQFACESVRARYTGRLRSAGLAADRIELLGPAKERGGHLAAYAQLDVALDTFPYNGTTTTCEALWMGVPVITFPGKTFAGRHSVSHLTNAGYPQFIAADAAGYVDLAVQWTSRLDELAVIRSQMREQVRNSPLCDAPRFARDLLAVLEAAWESRLAAK